jgi:glycosyltransferase involved in cell wall biosynthesis
MNAQLQSSLHADDVLVVSATTLLPDTGTTTRVQTTLSSLRRQVPGRIDVLTFESPRLLRNTPLRRARRTAFEKAGARTTFWPSLPQRLPRGRFIGAAWAAARVAAAQLTSHHDVVLAVGADAGAACAFAESLGRRPRLRVLEWHGVESEEAILTGSLRRGSARHEERVNIERRALEWADVVVAPSLGSRDWAMQLQPRAPQWMELPTITDLHLDAVALGAARESLRRELSWESNVVLVYAGGMHAWQQAGLMFESARALAEMLPAARFLVLTGDTPAAKAAAGRAGLASELFEIRSVPHSEVLGHLAAGDCALLLRAAHIVNRAASPTKFSEYLAAGVPVVTTDALPSFARICSAEGVGVVVRSDAGPAEVAQAILEATRGVSSTRELRERCQAASVSHFSPNAADRVYASLLTITGDPR